MGITGMAIVALAHMMLLLLKAPNVTPTVLIFGYLFTATITFAGLILRMNAVASKKNEQSQEEVKADEEE